MAKDRLYYTILPNYIVDNSDVYERVMYSEIKRFAGEEGTCFASVRRMAKRTGISKNTVKRTIKRLIKKGWIKEAGTKKTKGHPANCYSIVDIWGMNIEYYKEREKRKRVTTDPLNGSPEIPKNI